MEEMEALFKKIFEDNTKMIYKIKNPVVDGVTVIYKQQKTAEELKILALQKEVVLKDILL